MTIPEFLRRRWPDPEPVIDLTTPDAQAEYAALLDATEPEQPRHAVDFHASNAAEPPRFRPRKPWGPGLVPVVRASDGAV
ncbi:hypothetical protein [Streptomyces sp. NBC_00105]|uniref:hypothetical protein n=1 Tax=Streptomyces sp. NBC_00105 TaxID=2903622 RepID=UPI0032446F8F